MKDKKQLTVQRVHSCYERTERQAGMTNVKDKRQLRVQRFTAARLTLNELTDKHE